MSKKYVLPIAAVMLLIVGVALLITVLTTANDDVVQDITLSANDITRESLEFSANGLMPGDVREYTINLKGKSAGSYNVMLDFGVVEDGALKNFVDVTVQQGDRAHTYKLYELLDGKPVSFNCRIGSMQATVIKVIYSMPAEIGNEAQNASVDFAINLTAEKF